MIKSYKLPCPMNDIKRQKVLAVFEAYRLLADEISITQWNHFYTTGRFNKNLDIKSIATPLSERYKQTCQYQVVGMLTSFMSNRKNEVIELIWRSSLSSEQKNILSHIARSGAYRPNLVENFKPEDIRFVRSLYRHVMGKHNKPSMSNINMQLDNKVAVIEPSGNCFDYWIRFSTLESGKPILLPVASCSYFESALGVKNNSIQLNFKDDVISVVFSKESDDYKKLSEPEKLLKYQPKTKQLALDLGLVNLFGSDKGDLFGRNFRETILSYDKHITKLAANRQKQGLKVRSARYDKLTGKLKEYLKNEINRIINRIIALHAPGEIILEKLDFRSPVLSKRMNRLLNNFGKKIINAKFERIQEEYGIEVTYINPAYTSQECSRCGYVAKSNRKMQSEFLCGHCKAKINADINAPRVFLSRRSTGNVGIYTKKESVLQALIARFLERSCIQGSTCHNSLAKTLDENPYFGGWRNHPLLTIARGVETASRSKKDMEVHLL